MNGVSAMKVTTVKSGQEYRAKVSHNDQQYNITFTLTSAEGQPMVWLFTAKSSYGLYRLARFGGYLTPASIRAFILENWADAK